MKKIFADVISRGNYDLTALMGKIDRYHIEGKLTDAERDELYALARQDAKPQYDCAGEIEKLWAAVRALQAGNSGGGDDTAPTDEWPEYVQPTGAHDAYQTGDGVTFNGQHYRCTMDNCVWSPAVLPSAWEIVEEE